eukprot:1261071-Amorphochlora_amoeboformis.AAC.3
MLPIVAAAVRSKINCSGTERGNEKGYSEGFECRYEYESLQVFLKAEIMLPGVGSRGYGCPSEVRGHWFRLRMLTYMCVQIYMSVYVFERGCFSVLMVEALIKAPDGW